MLLVAYANVWPNYAHGRSPAARCSWNAETQDTDDVSMYTSQAADMAALILDYINR